MGLRLAVVTMLATVSMTSAARRTPEVTFRLDSYQAGHSPAHHLTLDTRGGDPEIGRVSLVYPDAFRFRSFLALGGAGTPVGTYDLDLDLDGTAERRLPLIALTPEVAYVDALGDGAFHAALDPRVRHLPGSGFEVELPLGGDGDPVSRVVPVDVGVTVTLFAGLLVNPALGGDYLVRASVETVDPDTGDADDGQGEPPVSSGFELPLHISGPSIVPFAKLSIDDFDLKKDGRDRVRIQLRGRFIQGHGSVGVDPRTDTVTVIIDWLERGSPSRRAFSQTIPAGAFRRTGSVHHFAGTPPGIDRFWLGPHDRFHIEIRDLMLMDPGRAASFTLAIGNNQGTTTVAIRDWPSRP